MKHVKLWCSLLLLVSGPASAGETDYYTWGGFDETVAAFTRLALVVSDNHFLVFAGIFGIAGIVFAAVGTAAKGVMGENVNPVMFAVQAAIGLAIFKGTILATGTVHVYDPVRNAYQPVGDVPGLVVFLGGALNKFERGMIEIADTASANPYSDNAGAINFALIKSAMNASVNDWYLKQSLVNYYTVCGLAALGNMDTGARQRLMHGSTDLINEFAEWTNAALPVVYHPPGDDAGEVRSCTDAWSGTGGLNSILTNPNTYTGVTESICMQAGFNPVDGGQMAKCRTLLQDSTSLYNVAVGSEVPFLRSILLAEAVSNAMNSSDVDRSTRTLVNRQVMAEGFGNAEAMNQWIPKVRAFMFAVVMGLVPLMAMFIVVPALWMRSILLLFGLFAWLTLWGIGDGFAVQMAYDAAADAFEQIRRQQLGVEAIMMSPEGSVQALGVFGKSRSTALAMASVLAFGLFKFGGYALTGLGQQWQNSIEQAGDNAAKQTLYPEQQASAQQALMGVGGTMGQVNSGGGFRQGSLAGGMGAIRQTAGAGAYIDESITGGASPGSNLGDFGRIEARDLMGEVAGTHLAAQRAGSDFGAIRQRGAETNAATRQTELNTTRDVASDVFGGDFQRGPEARATQNVAGEAALSKETPKDLFTAAGTETRQRIEAGVTLGAIAPNAATDAGRAQGTFSHVQSQATLETLESRGLEGLIRGERVGREQSVAQGLAVASIGPNISATTDQVAIANVADSYSRAMIGNELARQLGMDPNDVRDRINLSMLQQGHVGLAVTDGNRDQLVDYFRRSGAMGERELAAFEQSGGGFVRFAIDPTTGRADAAKADFVSSTDAGDTTRYTNSQVTRIGDEARLGNVTRVGDDTQRGDVLREGDVTRVGDEVHRGDVTRLGNERVLSETLAISDPNSMRPEYAPQTLSNLVDDLTGTLDQREVYAVAGAYAARLRVEGYGGSSDYSISESMQTAVGVGASSPRGGGGLIGGALRLIGIRAGFDANEQSTERASTTADFVTTGFASQIAPNLTEAQGIASQRFGPRETWNDETTAQAEAFIAQRWAAANEQDFQNLKTSLVDRTAVVQDKGQTERPLTNEIHDQIAGSALDRAYQYVDGLFK